LRLFTRRWELPTLPPGWTYWQQFYANTLRDALRKANNRRQEILSQMTQDDWRVAIAREMRAERWYEQPEQDETLIETQSPAIGSLVASRNGNFPKVSAAG